MVLRPRNFWPRRSAKEIPVQRCLLDGGTCEATAYQLYGYTCAAASLALGNYHNCTPEGKIAAEYVAIDDFVGMVRLCVATVLPGEKEAIRRRNCVGSWRRTREAIANFIADLTGKGRQRTRPNDYLRRSGTTISVS